MCILVYINKTSAASSRTISPTVPKTTLCIGGCCFLNPTAQFQWILGHFCVTCERLNGHCDVYGRPLVSYYIHTKYLLSGARN